LTKTAFVLLCFCAAAVVSADNILKQLHVVTRHGAGSYFDQSIHLTEFGKEQVRGLGVYLKSKYKQHLKDVVNHERYTVSMQSSSSGSAILTAQVLAQVLFDEEGTTSSNRTAYRLPSVPVDSTSFENDVYIRAFYEKCPALDTEIDQLAESKVWGDLRKKHVRLLEHLGRMSEFKSAATGPNHTIPLEDVYKVFDAVAVAKDVCVGVAAAGGSSTTNVTASDVTVDPSWCSEEQQKLAAGLTSSQWEELYKLAQEVELDKYNSEKAGRLGGANLWRQILAAVDDLSDDAEDAPAMYVWSGHYETILTMFAAVGLEVPRSGVNGSAAIPSYASAIIFEGYVDSEDASTVSVRMLYKDGGAESIHSRLAHIDGCDSEGYCTLDALRGMFSEYGINDWCDECGNDEADVCMRKALLEADQGSGSPSEGSGASGNQTSNANTIECPSTLSVGASAGAVAGTFFAGLLIGIIGMGWGCWRRNKYKERASRAYPTVMSSKSFPPPYPNADAEPNLTGLTEVSLDNANYA
jgi:hypothetical protein